VSDKSIIIMDSMNFWIESAKDDLLKVIEQVNAVILNDEEVRALTGKKNLLVAGRAILEKGPKYVIIKKGEHGVLAITKDWVVSFPAILLDSIIDPTGAGDSFAGALVGYLDQAGSFDKETWKKALVYATCVASYNVQAFSIKGIAAITKDDVYKQFENYKKASMVMEI
ncbi:MAG: sugar kinase, partial [Spirochaetes bacterium]|nr:sugar kinase [Spirochaetota bacterium]